MTADTGATSTGKTATTTTAADASTGKSKTAVPEYFLGIDVGGTKIAAGVVDADGEVLSVVKVPTGADRPADEIWNDLAAAGDEAIKQAGITRVAGVGCGCAGPMTWPEGVVSPLNIPDWREFPLRARIHERWPSGPARVHNDAVCVAIAEHWVGAAKGADNALGIVVSTGVGGGFILRGKVYNGGLGNAGHIGHATVAPDGLLCGCGAYGCLETVASGLSIVRWAQENGWSPPEGEEATGITLLASAKDGDETAVEAFRRSGMAVGQMLASCGALLDLDVVAIGGGLINAGPLLMEPLREGFERHSGFGFVKRLEIVAASAGQNAGILGAAALVAGGDKYWTPPLESAAT